MSFLGHFVQGADWAVPVQILKPDATVRDLSTATSVQMAIVDLSGASLVIPSVSCLSGTAGAAWATGVVVGIFPKNQTYLYPNRRYRVECKWVLGGLTDGVSSDTITVLPGRI